MYCRNIYFHIKQNDNIQELIDLLKNNNENVESVTMLDDYNGLIIEKDTSNIDYQTYKDIQNLIIEDFNILISFYISNFYKEKNPNYEIELAFKELLPKLKVDTYYFEDLLTLSLIENKYNLRSKISNILNKIDEDLLNTILVFIECNLNSSEAAKKLFLHRNTLNYRLDKFYDLTGINVRTFKGASAIYLLNLINN